MKRLPRIELMNVMNNCDESITRRQLLGRTGLTLGAFALGSLLAEDCPAAEDKVSRTHVPARARHVIYLHMIGAPSQLDLFDHKPELARWDNRPCPEEFIRGRRFAFLRGHPNLSASRFRFARHGQSGQVFSELLPHLGSVADELCVIRSLHTDEFNHAPAQLFLHTGFGRPGRPRSEERRVGKECRSTWSPHAKTNRSEVSA